MHKHMRRKHTHAQKTHTQLRSFPHMEGGVVQFLVVHHIELLYFSLLRLCHVCGGPSLMAPKTNVISFDGVTSK